MLLLSISFAVFHVWPAFAHTIHSLHKTGPIEMSGDCIRWPAVEKLGILFLFRKLSLALIDQKTAHLSACVLSSW